MRIGFVVAMDAEYVPFLEGLGALLETTVVVGVEFCKYDYHGKTIFLAKCGIGEIAASTATALLIGHFGCERIVNFGLVGSLRPDLKGGSILLVGDVVHYDCDVTAFGHALGAPVDMSSPFIHSDLDMIARLFTDTPAGVLPVVRLASGDKFVADSAFSNKIRSDFSADICDMEGAGIAIVCARAGVPFTMIKLVSDGADEAATGDFAVSKSTILSHSFDLVFSVFDLA